jgi:hypothetical protein
MRPPQADRPVLPIADGESQTMSDAVDETVGAVVWFAVVEAVIVDHGSNLKIDPTG